MRVELEPAYVLHTRNYRDSSLIVEILTPNYGRVGLVARGVKRSRGKKRSSGPKQLLVPLQSLLISFQGKGELKTLTAVEAAGSPVFLTGKILYSALYLNELLMRLLLPMDSHTLLYSAYEDVIQALATNLAGSQDADILLEQQLRRFEFTLLEELGYGFVFDFEGETGAAIERNNHYRLSPDMGFVRCYPESENGLPLPMFTGEQLHCMAMRDFSVAEVRLQAKRLTRMALQPLLGAKPLMSRELFAASGKTAKNPETNRRE